MSQSACSLLTSRSSLPMTWTGSTWLLDASPDLEVRDGKRTNHRLLRYRRETQVRC